MRLVLMGVSIVMLLSGCTHYTLLDSTDFDRGSASRVQFSRDNYECQTAAVIRQNEAGGGDVRGVYNRSYARCMAKRGYATNNIELLGIGA